MSELALEDFRNKHDCHFIYETEGLYFEIYKKPYISLGPKGYIRIPSLEFDEKYRLSVSDNQDKLICRFYFNSIKDVLKKCSELIVMKKHEKEEEVNHE